MIFILSFISSGLEFLSVHHTSTYKNFEFKFFTNIKFLGEISNNWQNYLLGTNVCKTLELRWWLMLKNYNGLNITSVISTWGTFSPFLYLLILLIVLPLFQVLKVQDNILF